jgi:hypothetical protein
VRRLFLTAVLLAVTPAAATSSADRPLLTYAVTPMSLRAGAIPMGLCATDLQGNTFRLNGLGLDRLYGRAGADFFVARDRTRDFIFGGPGNDSAWDDPVDVLSSIEH